MRERANKKSSRVLCLFVLCLGSCVFGLILSGCGGSGSGVTTVSSATGVSDLPAAPGAAQAGGATGSLSVQLIWDTPGGKFSAPAGVAAVRLSISASDMPTVTRDFTASANAGTLTAILAGTSRTVSAKGLDFLGGCLYSGSTSGVTVTANQTTNVTVTMSTPCTKPTWTKSSSNPIITAIGCLASSPYVIYDGTYKMWFNGGCPSGVGEAGTDLYYATSNNGVSWSSSQKIIDGSTLSRNHPTIIKDGLIYKMWYADNTTKLYYAESADGLSWQDFGNVLNDSAGIILPSVIKDGGIFKVWYSNPTWYSSSAGAGSKIFYAESPDGKNWTKIGVAMDIGTGGDFDAYGLNLNGRSVVLNDAGIYRMWYGGHTALTTGRVGYAVSVDGKTWDKQGLNIDLSGSENDIGPSSLLTYGSTLQLWYRCTINGTANICYADTATGTGITR